MLYAQLNKKLVNNNFIQYKLKCLTKTLEFRALSLMVAPYSTDDDKATFRCQLNRSPKQTFQPTTNAKLHPPYTSPTTTKHIDRHT
jgi:hypothetical protein